MFLISIAENPTIGVIELIPILAIMRADEYCETIAPREIRKILEFKENDEIERILEENRTIIKKRGENYG